MSKQCIFLLTGILLSGCTVGPDYRSPVLKTDKPWHPNQNVQKAISNTPIQTTWWESFNDPLLTSYLHEAAAHNLSIQIAESNIRQARAMKQIALSAFYPQVDGTATVISEQISKGTLEGFFSNLPFVDLVDRNQVIYNLGFDAQWELDLFGKNKRSVQSRQASLEKTIETRRKLLLSTFAEIARSYVELRGAQQHMNIVLNTIQLERNRVSLIRDQFKAGVNNQVDIARSESQLEQAESNLPHYLAQIRANAYQIAVMLGKEPQMILKDIETIKPLPHLSKKVPVGLRSDIIRQRPDVREAERNLAAAVAEIGVAEADFFPQVKLIGDMSFQSTAFDTLFNTSSVAWTLGPTASWPIFHAGQIKANVEQKQAAAQQSALQYKQTILEALQEAETAIERFGQSLQTNQRLKHRYASQQEALRLTHQRYEAGEDDRLSELTAQQNVLNAEAQTIESEIQSLTQVISLYKALGGGWEAFECPKRST